MDSKAYRVKKGRASFVNKTYLMIILPKFYQTHLKSQLSLVEYIFLIILVNILQPVENSTFHKIVSCIHVHS